ncbi:DUF2178 domain-containing protein [Streptococcus halichoeri]|uniref:DUF2178 domain-containing protein n=1 Tax=Streptococcus halichoeri TaxID=254785 RepID=UPI001357637C
MNLYTAILTIICSLIVLLMFFYNILCEEKITDKCGNDERRQKIEEKANKVMINFFSVITILCGLVIVCSLFWQDLNFNISLRGALTIIVFIMIIGNFCRIRAMKYFANNM